MSQEEGKDWKDNYEFPIGFYRFSLAAYGSINVRTKPFYDGDKNPSLSSAPRREFAVLLQPVTGWGESFNGSFLACSMLMNEALF